MEHVGRCSALWSERRDDVHCGLKGEIICERESVALRSKFVLCSVFVFLCMYIGKGDKDS